MRSPCVPRLAWPSPAPFSSNTRQARKGPLVRPVLLVVALFVASEASAQPPAPGNRAPTQPATTSTPASSSGGAGSSSAGSTSPSVGSPFLGGVPSGTVTAEPLLLSIGEAIGRALRYNLGGLNAEQSIDRARGA